MYQCISASVPFTYTQYISVDPLGQAFHWINYCNTNTRRLIIFVSIKGRFMVRQIIFINQCKIYTLIYNLIHFKKTFIFCENKILSFIKLKNKSNYIKFRFQSENSLLEIKLFNRSTFFNLFEIWFIFYINTYWFISR